MECLRIEIYRLDTIARNALEDVVSGPGGFPVFGGERPPLRFPDPGDADVCIGKKLDGFPGSRQRLRAAW